MAKNLKLRILVDDNRWYYLMRKRFWGWEQILRSAIREDVEKGFDNYIKYGTTETVLKEYNSELERINAEIG